MENLFPFILFCFCDELGFKSVVRNVVVEQDESMIPLGAFRPPVEGSSDSLSGLTKLPARSEGVLQDLGICREGNITAFACEQGAYWYGETDVGAYGQQKRGCFERDKRTIPCHEEPQKLAGPGRTSYLHH